jgi:SET domain-containing protein
MFVVETYLKESEGKGLGIFSKNFIKKGDIIWKFVEGFDTKVHISNANKLNDIQKKFIDKYFWREGEYYYSSCDHSIFLNHSYTPNSILDNDGNMIANYDINPGDEILENYSDFDFDFDLYKNELIND